MSRTPVKRNHQALRRSILRRREQHAIYAADVDREGGVSSRRGFADRIEMPGVYWIGVVILV